MGRVVMGGIVKLGELQFVVSQVVDIWGGDFIIEVIEVGIFYVIYQDEQDVGGRGYCFCCWCVGIQ